MLDTIEFHDIAINMKNMLSRDIHDHARAENTERNLETDQGIPLYEKMHQSQAAKVMVRK